MLRTKNLPPPRQLLAHFLRAGRAEDVSLRHRVLHIENPQGVARETLVNRLQLFQRETVQGFSRLLREGDDRPDEVMRLAERQSFADETVCQVRCEQCR